MEDKEKTQEQLIKKIKIQQRRIKELERLECKFQQQQQTLLVSEAKLRTIIEEHPDGIIIVDKDGMVLFFNETVVFLFNRRRDELLGKPFGFPVIAGESTEIDIIRTSREMGAIGTAQMRMMEIEWDKNPAYLITIHDTTEVKKTEALKVELAERKKLDQLKDEFISTVSHELRTPLTIIKEVISLVLDEIPGKINENQQKVLSSAKNNINRLARIINDLLDVSRIEAGGVELKKEPVDMPGLIKQVVSSFGPKAKKKGLELRVNLPEEEMDMFVDEDKIIEVFTNLMGNAIKFVKKGYIEISAYAKGDVIEYMVADTGIGIAGDDLPKVFGKFQQFGRVAGPGEKGTGLGLSICKSIVELHKGKIRVESEPGKGTRFIFTLPKYTHEEILKEHIENSIKESKRKGDKFSIIVISIANFTKAMKQLGKGRVHLLLKDLEGLARKTFKRMADVVVRSARETIVLLVKVERKDAFVIKTRLEDSVKEYLKKEGLQEEIRVSLGTATFPDEARDDKELIEKVKDDLELVHTGSEKRKGRRRKEIEIGIVGMSANWKRFNYVLSRDLSTEGVSLFTKDRLKPKTKVIISMLDKERQETSARHPASRIEIQGEVVWSKREGRVKELPYRAGIKFVGLTPETKKMILGILDF